MIPPLEWSDTWSMCFAGWGVIFFAALQAGRMASGIGRREFVSVIGGAVVWPLAAGAQQLGALPTIGYLHTASLGPYKQLTAAFLQGLKEAGYIEGQNVSIEYRWADGQFDRLPALAADLVELHVAAIAALGGSASPLAAKKLTSSIPIVFSSGEVDPVKSGLVISLNRPGENVTGVNPMTGALSAKRLELLHQIVPNATAIGYLTNASNPNSDNLAKDVHDAASSLGLQLYDQSAGTEQELEAAFTNFAERRVGALFVGNDPVFMARREQVVALAARQVLPASYYSREFVVAGGLASYAASFVDAYRLAGTYCGRILKGEKPADLPVVQSVKLELVINLKTARALGITVPQPLLATADEVIE
jgi:putative ABC transport system substrate-binding protein